MRHAIRTAAACLAAAVLTTLTQAPPAAAADTPPRVDLRVLVVDDGGPAIDAIGAALDGAGTPYTTVDLSDAGRPTVDAAFLSDTVDGRPRARFQAVVLPNDNPFGDGSPEMAALAAYEKRFGIRQVDAYTYARPAVGLNWAQNPGYIGTLDGSTARVTGAGAAGPFGYLDGQVPFEDNAPDVVESYGYLAVPRTDLPEGATFTPYVDAPIPGSTARGSLVGEYAHDGRRELVVTFVYNRHQQQYRLLARGIVAWLTQGVHLGVDRNHFAVHVDDVLAVDERWDAELNCTEGSAGCSAVETPIRMTAADAEYAAQWSAERGLTLDMAFNGGGSDIHRSQYGSDPLAARLLADQDSHRWINHTYNHLFLGCVQDLTVVPWRCTTDAAGQIRWESRPLITTQIDNNLAWADRNDLAVDESELVTGEHSGLATLPQQPVDNPNLAPSLTTTGVTWIASDSSRESGQRTVGPARTVPRYPMNIFFNAGRTAEQVDEYNWIYARASDGGSGLCEGSATTTCLDAPLDPRTGYESHIVPLEARIALRHVLGNDPRPHFIHQSNLAEDRIAYPALNRILDDYAGLFADDTPLVNLSMKQIGQEMQRRAAWRAALDAGNVTAYRIGETVTVSAPSGVRVPLTLPEGATQRSGGIDRPFGGPYAGLRSGWAEPALLGTRLTFGLAGAPNNLGLLDVVGGVVGGVLGGTLDLLRIPSGRITASATDPLVPAGVTDPVPYGPGDTVR